MLSANGWPVLETRPPSVLVPGTKVRLSVKPGDVATVLIEVARRFHEEVESIEQPVSEAPGVDDWGWAYRPIRGQSTGFSNHASGTAIDLNATLHPRGVPTSKGLTAAQIAKARAIVQSTRDKVTGENVVRWGGDYRTVPDAMHFEINASARAVARVAARFRETADARKPIPPKPPVTPAQEEDDMKADETLTFGQWGEDVLRQPDGEITVAEGEAIKVIAAAQTNESVYAMAKQLAKLTALAEAQQKTLDGILKALQKQSG